MLNSLDSFKCRKTLTVGTKKYVYYSLTAAEKNGLKGISASALLAEGHCWKTCCAMKMAQLGYR